MEKVPTIFERDWDGDRSRVLNEPVAACEWVFSGEGVPTQKFDGTSCLVERGRLFKRHAIKEDQERPENFREVARELNERTGETKIIGWIPVGEGREDIWHREAFSQYEHLSDGTYELVGPKIQGNPERYPVHSLVRHGEYTLLDVPRDFVGLRSFLEMRDMEGIVWHHPDGRLAKIKSRDFGIKRGAVVVH